MEFLQPPQNAFRADFESFQDAVHDLLRWPDPLKSEDGSIEL